MNKTTVFVFLLTVGVTFTAAIWLFRDTATMTTLTGWGHLIVGKLQTTFQPLINTWNTIPSPIRNIITMVIPTVCAIFFAWTKSRAMENLQQTQQQAQAQITQVSGEKTEVEKSLSKTLTQASGLQEELESAKGKLKLYEDFYEANKQMAQKVNAIPQQISSIESRVQGDVSTLTSMIRSLEAKIEETKRVK